MQHKKTVINYQVFFAYSRRSQYKLPGRFNYNRIAHGGATIVKRRDAAQGNTVNNLDYKYSILMHHPASSNKDNSKNKVISRIAHGMRRDMYVFMSKINKPLGTVTEAFITRKSL